MRKFMLLVMMLIFLVPSVAWARIDSTGHYVGHIPPTESDEIDRFLSSKVKPEIEAGDLSILRAKEEAVFDKALWLSDGNAHYLKALVLIEEERLRRENR